MIRIRAVALLAGLLLVSACSPSLSFGSAPSPAHVVMASGPAPTR
ncbi:hypothetical protein [Roseococcus sp. SYP-B2431]|nr:hypothetical protein [Roseococcus sp. SYP-B2431]